MHQIITLGIYRRLDNRLENLGDDSPRAWELHNRRRDALHAVFNGAGPIQVTNWGDTDDETRTHEFVELALSVATGAAFQYAIVPGLKWLGQKLAEKAVDTTLDELTKWVVAILRHEQEAKRILDFSITLPEGTRIEVDPPDRNATITVSFRDGTVSSIQYSKHA